MMRSRPRSMHPRGDGKYFLACMVPRGSLSLVASFPRDGAYARGAKKRNMRAASWGRPTQLLQY